MGSGRVPEMGDPGRYQKNRNQGEYQRGLDEYQEKDWRRGRIRASTGEPPD